jgi:flagellar FliL protein
MADTNTSAPPKASRGKGRLVTIGLAAIVVLGGGGVAAFWATHRTAEPAAAPRPAEHGLVTLEPFVVNLADQGGSRFLRVSVRLIVESIEQAEHVQKSDVSLTRARSAILELLTQQTADHLVTTEGKAALKDAISKKLEPVLEGTRVTDVLFSDFVVQF